MFTPDENTINCGSIENIGNEERDSKESMCEGENNERLETDASKDEIDDSMDIMKESDPQIELRAEMLDYLSMSTIAHFKSQQVDDPELDFNQKRQIAENILIQSPVQFLSRFGQHLNERHLTYFNDLQNNYEINFHLQHLHRFHCETKKQIDVKNRRYQALKKLTNESYFSETEMKDRNPLLYEQLIGRYLSQHEIEERNHKAMVENSTFVGVMLAQIERDQRDELHQRQMEVEDSAKEEVDSSDEESESESDDISNNIEMLEEDISDDEVKQMRRIKQISSSKKELLREEFYSYMYNSFLDGNDTNFDYSLVDFNPEYECLTVRAQDEEERYFDSETPEEAENVTEVLSEEDELDIFMKNLKPSPTLEGLVKQIDNL